MHTVQFRNIIASVPSNWNEINKRNLLYIAKKFPLEKTYGNSLYFFFHCLDLWRNPLLSLALARNFILSKRMNRAYKDDAVVEFGEQDFFEQQIIQAMHSMNNLDWLHKDLSFRNCLLDKFNFRFKTYFGPRENLSNVTADEFSHAEFFYVKFAKTQDIIFLNRLIATLWRNQSKQYNPNDIRADFSSFEIEKNAKSIAKLGYTTKIACLLTYIGMRNYFTKIPVVKDAFDGEESDGNTDVLKNYSLLLLRLAEGNTFGNFNQTKSTFIYDLILHIADMKQRHEQQQNKKNNS